MRDRLEEVLRLPPTPDVGPFAKGLAAAAGVDLLGESQTISPVEASEIARSFYIWERTIGILPYFFRGVALCTPAFSAVREVASRKAPTFVAISCTLAPDLSGTDLASIRSTVDAIVRGLASATALIGSELVQSNLSYVIIPKFLRHEIGNTHALLAARLAELTKQCKADLPKFSNSGDLPYWFSETIRLIRTEMLHIQKAHADILDSPDLTEPLDWNGIRGDGSHDIWRTVLAQLRFRGKDPSVDNVVVQLEFSGKTRSLPLRDPIPPDVEWPPALVISVYRLRQILGNLLKNAEKARATSASVTVRGHDSPGYVRVIVTDDGGAYIPKGSTGLGHTLIKRIIKGLVRKGYHDANFSCPSAGSKGEQKQFVLVLPTSLVSRSAG
jgi:hypothetical protein